MSAVAAVRFGVPLAMILAGVALLVTGGESADGAGVVIVGSGVVVFVLSALLRSSLAEEDDRAREQGARDFYSEHGHWPDEPERASEPAPPRPLVTPPHPGVREVSLPDGRSARRRGRPRRRRGG